jgi:NADH-quinone oxidoreductase subunit L
MLRLWKIVFLGEPRSAEAGHAHEGGITLTAPLVLLAALSVVGGYTAIYRGAFDGVFAHIPEAEGSARAVVLATGLTVLILGAGASLAFYTTDGSDALERRSPSVFGFLLALKASFDGAYDYYVAKVQQRLAMALNFVDLVVLAGIVVRGFAGMVEMAGFGVRTLHTGRINHYVYWFLGGVVILWAFAAGIL